MNISANQWKARTKNTVQFYESKLYFKEKQFNHSFQLADYFGPMIGEKKVVTIADLGAGMFSTTGSMWPETTVHLLPSDILAYQYNDILKHHNVKRLIPVVYQDMAALSYWDSFFDIVHCVNALDHCQDPDKALREMNRVCKPDGWIYLRHFIDNAVLQEYHGTHQWNMLPSGKDCLIWSKDGDEIMLSNYFDDCEVSIVNDTVDPNPLVVCVARKQWRTI